jgi:tetratricopeptide (TPR) repeat protein
MGSVPAEDPDVLTDDVWANPRAGALIEQAERRQLSGDHAGAVELLDQAIPLGGVDAAYAMGARTASLYELGRAGEARSQLEQLQNYTPFSAIAFHRAAEAAEMSGDLELALRWFDMALSRCADELKDAALDETGIGAQVALLLVGRRRVRRLLGLRPDDMDIASSPEPPEHPVA